MVSSICDAERVVDVLVPAELLDDGARDRTPSSRRRSWCPRHQGSRSSRAPHSWSTADAATGTPNSGPPMSLATVHRKWAPRCNQIRQVGPAGGTRRSGARGASEATRRLLAEYSRPGWAATAWARMAGSGTQEARTSARQAARVERPTVIHEGLPTQLPDIDPDETHEWLESLDEMIDDRGRERARYVMLKLLERSREKQVGVPALRSTDYINTIPPEREPWFPGDEDVERRIRAFLRWNAAIMVSERQPQGPRGRRPHRDLPVLGLALRGRLQPLLPRQGPPRRRRPGLHPGPRLPRHLRPRLPRGPARPRTSCCGSARRCSTASARGCRRTRTRG